MPAKSCSKYLTISPSKSTSQSDQSVSTWSAFSKLTSIFVTTSCSQYTETKSALFFVDRSQTETQDSSLESSDKKVNEVTEISVLLT